MKITKFADIDDKDKVYVLTLTNQSKYLIPGTIIDAIISLTPGTIFRIPTGNFINKSHIVDIEPHNKATKQYIQGKPELCLKYEIEYVKCEPFDYQFFNIL